MGFCAHELGWTPREFWQATPFELRSISHWRSDGLSSAEVKKLREILTWNSNT